MILWQMRSLLTTQSQDSYREQIHKEMMTRLHWKHRYGNLYPHNQPSTSPGSGPGLYTDSSETEPRPGTRGVLPPITMTTVRRRSDASLSSVSLPVTSLPSPPDRVRPFTVPPVMRAASPQTRQSLYQDSSHQVRQSLYQDSSHQVRQSLYQDSSHQVRQFLHQDSSHQVRQSLYQDSSHQVRQSLYQDSSHQVRQSLYQDSSHQVRQSLYQDSSHQVRQSLYQDSSHQVRQFLHQDSSHQVRQSLYQDSSHQVRQSLYQDSSHQGRGRSLYLRRRGQMLPEQKFDFPLVSSWEYGWRLGDFTLDYKTPTRARSSVVKSTFYARNGVFNESSPTDTLG
uniref:Sperm microtubule inner protein 1 C-terminal domain-containing protein n=1 Tax=Knipowitschia caucasica TaxID=637954 RepID=A0AAV2MLK1_KNICA